MSATLDGARVAALLGDAAGYREPGPQLPGRHALSRARSARPHRGAGGRRRRARLARRAGLAAGVPAGRRRNPPHRDAAEGARAAMQASISLRSTARSMRASRTAPLRRRRPDRRKVVLATSIAETSLTIEGVRVVIDSGLVARAALRAGCRLDAAGDRARFARRRRPAPRPRRPHRAGRVLPAVGRAADRLFGALYAAGNSLRRSVELRARPGAVGRERSGDARLSRSAAASGADRSARLAERAWRASTRRAASPRKADACARCRCRRGWRAWWSMPRARGPGAWPPKSPQS